MNPSLLLIPDRYKASKLYSQIPDSGTGDLAFTRANDTATRVNSAGLIEKVRTNLNTYSQDFTATGGWASLFGATITRTANYGTAPDGTTTSTRIVFTSGSQIYSKTISGLTGNIGVFSLWIKGTAGETIAITYGGASDKLVTLGTGWTRFNTNGNSASNNTIYINTFLSATALDIEVWGGQVEFGDIATPYIPTTTAAVSVGPVANIPRIDYTGGGCGKLLLEPQRVNKWFFSEQFDNAEWLKTNVTFTANSAVSPDGFMNADKMVDTTANDEHRIRATSALFTITTATTFSIFAKAAEYSKFAIANLSLSTYVKFDLSTGSVISTGSGFSNAKIENYGNGWYRLSATSSDVNTFGYGLLNDAGDFVFTGTGTKGVFIYGAQVEEAAYATSYIPTLGASVTRSADAASKTGISSLIGQTAGTIYWEGVVNGIPVDQTIFGVEKEASSFVIRFGGDGTNIYAQSYNGSTNLFFQTTSPNVGQTIKLAFAYAAGSYAFYKNGTLVAAGTNATAIPACDKLQTNVLWSTAGGIGAYTTGSAALYTSRLSNADLASLTTL